MSWSAIKNQCKPLNNREDVEYKSGCMTKKRYPNKAVADRICKIMRRKYKKEFNSYDCKFCVKAVHIGSQS